MAATTLLSDNGVTSGITGYTLTGGNDGTLQLQTTTAGGAATTAVTINNSQNVGIGTSSPAGLVHLYADGTNLDIQTSNNSNYSKVRFKGSGGAVGGQVSGLGGVAGLAFYQSTTEAMRIDSSGNLLVGTTTAFGNSGCTGIRKGSTGQLIIGADSGGFYHQAVGNYYLVTTAGGSTSDASLKTNVQQLTGALEKVCAIRGVNFDFIEEPMCTADQGTQLGVIAQEVEAQYPEIVLTNEEGIKTVRYDRLVAPLIEAIKEQQALITTLTERITALEGTQ